MAHPPLTARPARGANPAPVLVTPTVPFCLSAAAMRPIARLLGHPTDAYYADDAKQVAISVAVFRICFLSFLVLECAALLLISLGQKAAQVPHPLHVAEPLFAACVVSCNVLYYMAAALNPGYISPQGDDVDTELLSTLGLNTKRCKHCHLVRPLRCKHCHHCGRCVARFDHHCFWLGTCVGSNNRRVFVALVSMMTVTIPWGLNLMLVWPNNEAWQRWLRLFVMLSGLVLCIFVLFLCCFHSYAVGSNITTYEFAKMEKQTVPFGAFDQGVMTNCVRFCCVDVGAVNFATPQMLEGNSDPWWRVLFGVLCQRRFRSRSVTSMV